MRRYIRQRSGISQQSLADAVGVTRPAVSLWESGARTPRGHRLVAYQRLLDELVKAGQGR
jgi:transcriptional regulator with XRE-family HTH domain